MCDKKFDQIELIYSSAIVFLEPLIFILLSQDFIINMNRNFYRICFADIPFSVSQKTRDSFLEGDHQGSFRLEKFYNLYPL